ncbi:hypothetical protein CPB83DRAFT_889824 [Crepidotus variabilis]|uniref:Uncharacterized protein n=1 Tax=Crepidotus variabilis TaxID=179855 RepID=A0A9P6ESW4_9AGAR|nr:hypothetical protein CPB83DRAFT_889824 [Crepidotus variabilis]
MEYPQVASTSRVLLPSENQVYRNHEARPPLRRSQGFKRQPSPLAASLSSEELSRDSTVASTFPLGHVSSVPNGRQILMSPPHVPVQNPLTSTSSNMPQSHNKPLPSPTPNPEYYDDMPSGCFCFPLSCVTGLSNFFRREAAPTPNLLLIRNEYNAHQLPPPIP